jgi:hypothetical protein
LLELCKSSSLAHERFNESQEPDDRKAAFILIWPGSNLGPLLGILITGPLGFVVGALGALVFPRLRASG